MTIAQSRKNVNLQHPLLRLKNLASGGNATHHKPYNLPGILGPPVWKHRFAITWWMSSDVQLCFFFLKFWSRIVSINQIKNTGTQQIYSQGSLRDLSSTNTYITFTVWGYESMNLKNCILTTLNNKIEVLKS